METNTVVGLIVVIVIGLGLAGLSVPLLMGKCAGLVAGYSTMSPKERESWDGPALARFTHSGLPKNRLIRGAFTASIIEASPPDGNGFFMQGAAFFNQNKLRQSRSLFALRIRPRRPGR